MVSARQRPTGSPSAIWHLANHPRMIAGTSGLLSLFRRQFTPRSLLLRTKPSFPLLQLAGWVRRRESILNGGTGTTRVGKIRIVRIPGDHAAFGEVFYGKAVPGDHVQRVNKY